MPRAAGDADAIYRRVTEEAPLAGSRWYGKLIEALQSLDTFPERDQVDTVRILQIRHGARREPSFTL